MREIEKDEGYVVCATWPSDDQGELVLESYIKGSTLEKVKKRMEHPNIKDKNPRIGKIIFPFDNEL